MVVMEAAAHGTPSVVVDGAGQRSGRAGRGRRQRRGRRIGDAARTWATRSCGCTRPARSCATPPRAWFAAHAPSLSLDSSVESVVDALPRPASARRSSRPCPAAVALPRESRGLLDARGARAARASRRSPSSRSIACAIAASSSGSNSSAASPATSARLVASRGQHGHPARHRLEHRKPEALVQRGEHEGVGRGVEVLELLAGSQPRKRTSSTSPSRPRRRAAPPRAGWHSPATRAPAAAAASMQRKRARAAARGSCAAAWRRP